MDINAGIHQEGMKREAGIVKNAQPIATTKAYAALMNQKAKDRMEKVRRNVRIMDMLQAVSRYKISNLPIGLRSKLVQRIMYYRGNAMWYKDFDLDRYFLLPYSLTAVDDQNIDFYGQYTMVKPVSFNGKSTDNRKSNTPRTGKDVYLGTISRIPVYDMEELEYLLKMDADKLEDKYFPLKKDKSGKTIPNGRKTTKGMSGKEWCQHNLCVIFRDYTQQLSENNISRSITQEAFIDMQAETLPMIRTMMLKAAMPKLVKTSDQGVVDSLLAELQTIEDSIIEGKTMLPVTAFQDLQEIDSKDAGRVIETMAKMYEGFNNIRKTFLGIPNDGAFKKNAHMLQDEQDTNAASTDSILDDGLENYKEQFGMVNKLYDLKIAVEIAGAVNENAAEDEDDEDAQSAASEDQATKEGDEGE